MPSGRVVVDIFANSVKGFLVTNDVFEIVSVPNGQSRRAAHFVDSL